MPQTPDRRPGEADEEGMIFEPSLTDPPVVGGVRFVGGAFRFRDSGGVYDPRSASGVTEAAHKTLRQLIHFIDDGPAEGFASGAYREILPSASPFPTSVVWWTSAAKTAKIVEKLITRNSNQTPSQIQWKVYAVDGTTVLATVTDTISYSGVFETSRTRAIT